MLQYKVITSSDNKTFKSFQELLNSKGIKKNKKALIQGRIIVNELFAKFFKSKMEVLFTEDHGFPANYGPNCTGYLLDKALFNELNVNGVDYPILCLSTPEFHPFDSTDRQRLKVFLPLGDPKNLGGALRNALAFEADSVVLLKESANPFHPKAIKASSGACFFNEMQSGPSINDLNLDNLFILDGAGEPLPEVKWTKNINLLVGEEGQGFPDHLIQSARKISIPISDKIESLNANQALGIALYEIQKHRSKKL